MNRREFLGNLINYYMIVGATGEPYGLLLPYTFGTKYKNTQLKYSAYKYSRPYSRVIVVAIYDSNGACVFCNAQTAAPSFSSFYTKTTINGVSCYYADTSYSDFIIDINKPGVYTSKVLYVSNQIAVANTEIQFEVLNVPLEKNYGKETQAIEINHGIVYDANAAATINGDIPNSCIIKINQ